MYFGTSAPTTFKYEVIETTIDKTFRYFSYTVLLATMFLVQSIISQRAATSLTHGAFLTDADIDGLVPDRNISISNALEILQSCT